MTKKKKKKDDEESFASKLAGFAAALEKSGEDGEEDEFTRNIKGLEEVFLGLTDIIETYKKNNPAKEAEEETPSDEPKSPSLTPDERPEGKTPPEPKLPRDEVYTKPLLDEYAQEIDKNREFMGLHKNGELAMGKFEFNFLQDKAFDYDSDISKKIFSNTTEAPPFYKKLVDTNLKHFDYSNEGVYKTNHSSFIDSVKLASTENIQEPVKTNTKEGIAEAATDTKPNVPTKLENKVDINPIPTSNINQQINQQEDTNIVNEIQDQQETLDPNRKGFINNEPTTGIQDQLLEAGFEPEQLTKLQQAYVENYGARDDRLKKIFSIFGGAR